MQITSKVIRILALVIVLVLLLVIVPATPALAQTISASPSSGLPGTIVTVNCTGFTAYATQTLYIYFRDRYQAERVVSALGTFSAIFPVPSDAAVGSAVISVQNSYSYTTNYLASVSFTVLAQTDVTVSPASGAVGETVTVSGSGFTAGANVAIAFDTTTVVPTVPAGAGGTFITTFPVPDSFGGAHTIRATDTNSLTDTASFTTTQSMFIEPTSGVVGTTVTVSGTGFKAAGTVTITYGNESVDTTPTTVPTDNNGTFSASFQVPASSSVAHEVKASDGTYSLTASFTPTATFSLGKTVGYVGDEITFSGAGFVAGQPVNITFDGTVVETVDAESNGNVSSVFNVPAAVGGTYDVVASDNTNTVIAVFTISVSASIDRMTGNVGTEVTISGVGFSGVVTITYDDIEVARVPADATGAFSATFPVPASEGGEHIITASDKTNQIESIFIMESQAPSVPELQLPADGEKAEEEASFDWEDASDLSGVTYTFQIAIDEDFTEDSIIFQKTGLSASQYTLSPRDKLESTKKEAPYYWRVKAVDGAGNESDWSTPSSFYVGFSLSLPDWARYAIIGAAVVLAGFIGFLIGRRTAYF